MEREQHEISGPYFVQNAAKIDCKKRSGYIRTMDGGADACQGGQNCDWTDKSYLTPLLEYLKINDQTK